VPVEESIEVTPPERFMSEAAITEHFESRAYPENESFNPVNNDGNQEESERLFGLLKEKQAGADVRVVSRGR